MNFRQNLRKMKLLRTLASLNITVTGLFLLFVLTLWGTVAQVQNGLYLAQERFFHSFYFLILGFIPFPGAQLVMWVLFFNLIAVMLIRFEYEWKNIGILIIHFGLLSFLIAAYVTLNCTQESHLTLKEGEAANVSEAYHDWELAVWQDTPQQDKLKSVRRVTAVDITRFADAKEVTFKDMGIHIQLVGYYRNAQAYRTGADQATFKNASGIGRLSSVKLHKEPEKNTPGAVLRVAADGRSFDLLLYGAESTPTRFESQGKTCNAILRRKRYVMPFTLKLLEFIKEEHPGTDTPKSFKSRVAVETSGQWREKVISMNNPLRHNDYTFYQASYSIDNMNNVRSTLAVVKNSGRVLPYVSTFVTVAGLAVHFIMSGFRTRKRPKEKTKD